MKKIYKGVIFFDLYLFSLKVGFKALGRGVFTKESFKRILCPMDPYRYYELPKVGSSLKLLPGSKVLDISSPKLITYYLAEKFPKVTFYCTDIDEVELKNWEKVIGKKSNIVSTRQDARKLSYKSSFFDEVFSISVIEHVEDNNGNGDSRMIKEVFRVLKKHGLFIFTTVVDKKFKKIFKNRKQFFERVYSYDTIIKRILKVVKSIKKDEEISSFRFPSYLKMFNTWSPWAAIFGIINLLVCPWNIITNKSNIVKDTSVYFCILEKS